MRERSSWNSGERGSKLAASVEEMAEAAEELRAAEGVMRRPEEMCLAALAEEVGVDGSRGSKGMPSIVAMSSMSLNGSRVLFNMSTVCWRECLGEEVKI